MMNDNLERKLNARLDRIFRDEFDEDIDKGIDMLNELYSDSYDQEVFLDFEEYAEETDLTASDALVLEYCGDSDLDNVKAFYRNDDFVTDDPFYGLYLYSVEQKLETLNTFHMTLAKTAVDIETAIDEKRILTHDELEELREVESFEYGWYYNIIEKITGIVDETLARMENNNPRALAKFVGELCIVWCDVVYKDDLNEYLSFKEPSRVLNIIPSHDYDRESEYFIFEEEANGKEFVHNHIISALENHYDMLEIYEALARDYRAELLACY